MIETFRIAIWEFARQSYWRLMEAAASNITSWRVQYVQESATLSILVFFSVILVFTFVVIDRLVREKPASACGWLIALVACVTLMTGGNHDIEQHIYRIATLSDELRHGKLSPIIDSKVQGESLPIFVFYGIFPYVFPTLIDAVIENSTLSYRIAAAIYFVILGIGVRRIAIIFEIGQGQTEVSSRPVYLATFLFLSSNYIVGNWTVRAAFAEVTVMALTPWVVLALRSGSLWRLCALLLAQLAAHPIVFPQALFGAVLFTALVFQPALPDLAKRACLAFAGSVTIATPSWLPQVLWKNWIGGPDATAMNFFYNSFQSPWLLFSPISFVTIGPWIIMASLVGLIGNRTAPKAAVLPIMAIFLLSLVFQTDVLRPLVLRIPFLDMGQFVWRLMALSALLGLGVLLLISSSWGVDRSWRWICCAAAASLVPFLALNTAAHSRLVFAYVPNDVFREAYETRNKVWGLVEFRPRYERLPEVCEQARTFAQHVSYVEVRRGGVRPDAAYLHIYNAPIGFVTYEAGGRPIEPIGHCEQSLVFENLPSNALLNANETKISYLFYIRLLMSIAVIVILLHIIIYLSNNNCVCLLKEVARQR